jgi:hypothetical protein
MNIVFRDNVKVFSLTLEDVSLKFLIVLYKQRKLVILQYYIEIVHSYIIANIINNISNFIIINHLSTKRVQKKLK